jgi:DNA invertase Pin-like site-specific DNA recombinase
MDICIYMRVCCVAQQDRQPFAAQEDVQTRYYARHDFTVRRIYLDAGVSGLLPLDRRPTRRRLLRDARLGKFEQLLVPALDRLGRDVEV